MRSFVTAGCVLLVSGAAGAAGQVPATTPADEPLRVFVDCEECDFDHFRREVGFVDYVRDRAVAQVHVLVTSQDTGGGGTEHTFFFIGQQQFAGRQDTLRWIAPQTASEEEERAGMTRTFALGLVPFAARTAAARDLSIRYDPERAAAAPGAPARDPWNLWVFRTRLGGSLEGESRSSSVSLDGSLSASRTTDDIKLDFGASLDYSEDRFELRDSTTFVSATRDWEVDGVIVWSVGTHWSAGISTNLRSETRLNHDFAATAAPALEYSLYPYSESTRRQITVLYTVGPSFFDYEEITLFDQLEESRLEQELEISAEFQQPWGEVDGSIEWSNFLSDFALHRIDFNGGLEVRLFQGLNLDLRGNVARIKNQIYVPREDIPDEEILLRRRELGTDFEYELELGVSFTFGSVFNNVVNPRLTRGGDFN
jgi:hypothetical protein